MFKFASIFSAISRPTISLPPFDIGKYLGETSIEAPENSITDNYIPYLEIRRILFIHQDRKGVCPIRRDWGKALIETTSDDVISFQNIKGCMSSKSGLTNFEQMRYHPKSSSNVNFHIKSYANCVEELAEKVLNGNGDCAIYKGKPGHVVKQEWDGEMWLANDGGSHRSAAVWHIDREQGRERLLPARVTTNALSYNFREQCVTHSIWFFKLPSRPNIHEISSKFNQNGIQLSVQSDGFIFGNPPDFCLIVKKSDSHHDEIAASMKTAFNLSEWVNSAYASIPKLAFTPASYRGATL